MMRFQLDRTWQRFGRVVISGSPLTVFRVTDAGARILDALERDDDVDRSHLTDRLVAAGAIHPTFDTTDEIEGHPERSVFAAHSFSPDDVTVVTPRLGGIAATDGRIVVDDGSDPPVVGATIRLDRNRGPAAARNAARPLVTTPLVAFVDADIELLDDIGLQCWLTPLLPHFDDDRIGLVAPRLAGEPGSPLDLGDEPARIRAGTRVGYVPAAAIVVRTAAYDTVGGFDETLRFGEDVDFVWRLDQAGWACRYEPASTVWHEPRPTTAGRLRQHVGYGSSAAPLALRHPNELSPVRTNGWTAAVWALAAMGRGFAGAALAIGSAAALVPKLRDVPPRVSLRLALTGHALAGRQFASAIRRVWWPPLAIAALFSRRARGLAIAAIAVDVAASPTDVAYGWGVWKGMIAHRTWRPAIPIFAPWPGPRSRPHFNRGQTPSET